MLNNAELKRMDLTDGKYLDIIRNNVLSDARLKQFSKNAH